MEIFHPNWQMKTKRNLKCGWKVGLRKSKQNFYASSKAIFISMPIAQLTMELVFKKSIKDKKLIEAMNYCLTYI